MPIDLTYGATKQLPGIGALDPNNWYRYHGGTGLNDFQATGMVRANPTGKYDATYFSQGQAQPKYARSGGNTSVVEAHPSAAKATTTYNATNPYGTTEKLTKNVDRFRVWQMDKGAYKSVYDNLTPYKYYGRQALGMLEKAAPPLVLADTAVTAATTPTSQYAARFGLSQPTTLAGGLGMRALGAASDMGNVLGLGLPQRYIYRDGPQASFTGDLTAGVDRIAGLFKK